MKKWVIVAACVLIVLVGVRTLIGQGEGPTDSAQVISALNESIKASREGRDGGVLDLLSKHLTVNDQEAAGNFKDIASFIRKQRPDVVVESPLPTLQGGTAMIRSDVDLKFSLLGQDKTVRMKDVRLTFVKEPAVKWLVFPTMKWKLSAVQASDLPPVDLTGSQ